MSILNNNIITRDYFISKGNVIILSKNDMYTLKNSMLPINNIIISKSNQSFALYYHLMK